MRSVGGEDGEAKPAKLKGDTIMMVRPESSSALVFWKGKRFELSWQRDGFKSRAKQKAGL